MALNHVHFLLSLPSDPCALYSALHLLCVLWLYIRHSLTRIKRSLIYPWVYFPMVAGKLTQSGVPIDECGIDLYESVLPRPSRYRDGHRLHHGTPAFCASNLEVGSDWKLL